MFHAASLQPNRVNCQQLFSVFTACNIQSMESIEKEQFAARMHQVADLLGIPPTGKNRQKLLGRKFSVSQESARRWLSGESYPKTVQAIEIAKTAKVSYEWFMTGRGAALTGLQFSDTDSEKKVLQAMQRMDEETKTKLIAITETLADPKEKAQPKRYGDKENRQRENSFKEERRQTPWHYKGDKNG